MEACKLQDTQFGQPLEEGWSIGPPCKEDDHGQFLTIKEIGTVPHRYTSSNDKSFQYSSRFRDGRSAGAFSFLQQSTYSTENA